jgi:hypothetical protein
MTAGGGLGVSGAAPVDRNQGYVDGCVNQPSGRKVGSVEPSTIREGEGNTAQGVEGR